MTTKRKSPEPHYDKPKPPPPGPVTHLTRDPKTGEMVNVESLKKKAKKHRVPRVPVGTVPDAQHVARPVSVSVTLEYKAYLSGDMESLGKMHEHFNSSIRDLYLLARKLGVSVIKADGCMRGLTREEAIVLIPRKFHMERDGRHICDTPFVSRRFLTTDDAKVTCKLCLRKLEEES